MELYVFQDEEGNQDSYSTLNAVEAREYAVKYGRAWVAQTYEFVDSEIVADFRKKLEEAR